MTSNSNVIFIPEAQKYGFCEGVERAHQGLENLSSVANELNVGTIYGYHDIVHNEDVARYHRKNGVQFIDDVSEAPDASIVMGSAHGSSPLVPIDVESRGGLFFDSACPLVINTHNAVWNGRKYGEKLLYIVGKNPDNGGKIHDEVLGTMGHMDFNKRGNADPVERVYAEQEEDPVEIAERLLGDGLSLKYRMLAQTTLLATRVLDLKSEIASELSKLQPEAQIQRVDRRDVCFAVEKRQQGVHDIFAAGIDLQHVVVVTDPNSKNGMGYVNLAKQIIEDKGFEIKVHAVADRDDIPEGVEGNIGVTASASTPDETTRGVVEELGGNPELVVDFRPTFQLGGVSREAIKKRVHKWQVAA